MKEVMNSCMWVNCAGIVPLGSKHKNPYNSASSQRVLIIFFKCFSMFVPSTVKKISSLLAVVVTELSRKKVKNQYF
jgi:hypothetical protein